MRLEYSTLRTQSHRYTIHCSCPYDYRITHPAVFTTPTLNHPRSSHNYPLKHNFNILIDAFFKLVIQKYPGGMMAGYGESCTGWRVRGFPAEYKLLLVASKRPKHLWATPNFQLNGILGVLSPALKVTTTRSWSLTSICCHDKEWVEFYLLFHYTISWREQRQMYFSKVPAWCTGEVKNNMIHIFRWVRNISTCITLFLFLKSEENSS
jgi:hypothetical protein